MNNQTQLGINRTGLQMAPFQGSSMLDYAQEKALEAPVDDGQFEEVHRNYLQEADRVGSVAVPSTFKGMLKTGSAKMRGLKPEVLLDKLGERLAFERGGTRLYDAMIMKVMSLQDLRTPNGSSDHPSADADTDAYEALGSDGNARTAGAVGAMGTRASRVDLPSLQRIRHEEQEHMQLVKAALLELGADPTAMTPCADIVGVSSMGLMQTITDPRTTVAQCLNALLTAELADQAGWELLMELAEQLGYDEMAVRFSVAATTEAEHQALVKDWLRAEIMGEAA